MSIVSSIISAVVVATMVGTAWWVVQNWKRWTSELARSFVAWNDRLAAEEHVEFREYVATLKRAWKEAPGALIPLVLIFLVERVLLWPITGLPRWCRTTFAEVLRSTFGSTPEERARGGSALLRRAAWSAVGVVAADEALEFFDTGVDSAGTLGVLPATEPAVDGDAWARHDAHTAPPSDWSERAAAGDFGQPSEIDGDPRVHEVRGYRREDGTWVDGYWRGDRDSRA